MSFGWLPRSDSLSMSTTLASALLTILMNIIILLGKGRSKHTHLTCQSVKEHLPTWLRKEKEEQLRRKTPSLCTDGTPSCTSTWSTITTGHTVYRCEVVRNDPSTCRSLPQSTHFFLFFLFLSSFFLTGLACRWVQMGACQSSAFLSSYHFVDI